MDQCWYGWHDERYAGPESSGRRKKEHWRQEVEMRLLGVKMPEQKR
jgi:hypothetical protein